MEGIRGRMRVDLANRNPDKRSVKVEVLAEILGIPTGWSEEVTLEPHGKATIHVPVQPADSGRLVWIMRVEGTDGELLHESSGAIEVEPAPLPRIASGPIGSTIELVLGDYPRGGDVEVICSIREDQEAEGTLRVSIGDETREGIVRPEEPTSFLFEGAAIGDSVLVSTEWIEGSGDLLIEVRTVN